VDVGDGLSSNKVEMIFVECDLPVKRVVDVADDNTDELDLLSD
jgi:hypothetical protein